MRLAILLLLPVLAWGQSQPPPQAGKAREEPKQQAGPNQKEAAILSRGTKDAPLVIEALESPNKQEDAAKEEARADAELSTNRWIMIFTLVLTVFTAIQIGFYLKHRSEDAKDYINEHRPYLSFRVIDLPWFKPNAIIHYNLLCTNHGKTPALDVGYGAHFRIITKGQDFGKRPELANPKRMNLFPNTHVAAADLPRLHCNTNQSFTDAELATIGAGTHEMQLEVVFKYGDLFSKDEHLTIERFLVVENPVEGLGPQLFIIPETSVLT